MSILKKLLLITFFFSSFGISVFIGYIVTYSFLSTNVPPLSGSSENLKTLDFTIKHMNLLINLIIEYFSFLEENSKILDSKKINDYRTLIYQIRKDYIREIEKNSSTISEPIDKIVKEYINLLDRVDTMMKFPADRALMNIVCVDIRNLLNTLKKASTSYKLHIETDIDRVMKKIDSVCPL